VQDKVSVAMTFNALALYDRKHVTLLVLARIEKEHISSTFRVKG
jgi:hypothetical protein